MVFALSLSLSLQQSKVLVSVQDSRHIDYVQNKKLQNLIGERESGACSSSRQHARLNLTRLETKLYTFSQTIDHTTKTSTATAATTVDPTQLKTFVLLIIRTSRFDSSRVESIDRSRFDLYALDEYSACRNSRQIHANNIQSIFSFILINQDITMYICMCIYTCIEKERE